MTIKPIQNEKSILAGIKKDYDSITHHKNQLLKYAFSLGEKLIEAKKLVPHGQWENWLNAHSELSFGRIQASKYMQIASEKVLVNAFFSDVKSVDGLCKALATVTDEQRAEIERHEAEKQKQAELDQSEKAAQLEAKKAETVIPVTPAKEPEVIEGDFKEVESTGMDLGCEIIYEEPEREEPETIEQVLTEANEILMLDNAELAKEIQSVKKILESNDQVLAALTENKRILELNRVLNERIAGLQGEKNAAIKEAKYQKNRADKLEKQLELVKKND